MGLKSSYQELFQGAGIILFMSFLSYVFMFVFKMIGSRYFGPEDWGYFEFGVTILGFMFIFSLIGIHSSIPRYVSDYISKKDSKSLSSFIGFSSIVPLVISLVFTALFFLTIPFLKDIFSFNSMSVYVLTFVFLSLPFRVLEIVLSNILSGYKRMLYCQWSTVLKPFILIVGVGLIIYFNLSLFYLLLLYFISIVLSFILNFFLTKRIDVPFSLFKQSQTKEWFNFSIPLFVSGFLMYLIGWSDNIIIGIFLSAELLGIYAIAYSTASLLKFVQLAFSRIASPLFMELHNKKSEDLGFLYTKSQKWVLLFSLPFILLLIFFSKKILFILFGAEYVVGSAALSIISLGFLINLYTGLNEVIVHVYKKTKHIAKVNIFIAILNIVLNVLLIPYIGITGAAISSAICLSLQNILFYLYARRLYPLFIDHKSNFKLIIISLLGIIVLKIFSLVWDNNYLLVFLFLLLLCLYFILIFILKFLDKDDLDTLSKLERKYGKSVPSLSKLLRMLFKLFSR
ncbi:flippase [Candidatus Woesearchaeota archaeon]|nr:flippase [Candidatus Woesearchaeota archaeon]